MACSAPIVQTIHYIMKHCLLFIFLFTVSIHQLSSQITVTNAAGVGRRVVRALVAATDQNVAAATVVDVHAAAQEQVHWDPLDDFFLKSGG